MTSDAFVAMIEDKLAAYGLEKVVPDGELLGATYCAFHRSRRLRERFTEMARLFDQEAEAVAIPDDLEHRVRADKETRRRKSGDFTGDGGDVEGGVP